MKEKQVRNHPRTNINLENFLRMAFLPTGAREYMNEVNYELELGPIQSQIQLGVATSFDIVKYLPYVALAYHLLKTG